MQEYSLIAGRSLGSYGEVFGGGGEEVVGCRGGCCGATGDSWRSLGRLWGEIVGGGWRLGVIGLKAFGGAISHVSGKDLSVPTYKGRVIR